MLVVSLQSIQVHSLVLSAEQSGHPSGLLVHQHNNQPIEQSSKMENDFATVSLVQETPKDNSQHESPCHPAHVLCTFNHDLMESRLFIAVRETSNPAAALSIPPSLDTPPPKL